MFIGAAPGFVYVNRDCGSNGADGRFFPHIVPANVDDLPPERRQYGFHNIDFPFLSAADPGIGIFQAAGTCRLELQLPRYGIAAVRAGQYIPGEDGRLYLWKGEVRFDE